MCLTCWCVALHGQHDASRQIKNATPGDALRQAADYYDIPILFSDNFLTDTSRVTIDLEQYPIEAGIRRIVGKAQVKIVKKDGRYLLKKDSGHLVLQGYVKAEDGGEKLPYASILVDGVRPVIANEEGYYQVRLKKGMHWLKASFIAHHDTIVKRKFLKSERYDFVLATSNVIEAVIVEKSKDIEAVRDVQKYSHNDLMQLAKATPDMGGTSDLLNNARLLPGVQSGAGGIGGHFVRGGGNGNNLYLIDGIPIYNPYHVLGLTSIFNPSITKSFQVYKSGFEAEYGDVTSAIFDIKIKDGNTQNINGDFSVNTNDVTGSLEIPIIKNKAGLMLYGRRDITDFYYDEIIKDVTASENFEGEPNLLEKNYHDFIGKLHFEIGKKHFLNLNYYRSRDDIQSENSTFFEVEESRLDWGNDIYSLKWNFMLADDLFLKTTASYNRYFSSNINFYAFEYDDDFETEIEEYYYAEQGSSNESFSINTKLDKLWNQQNRTVFTGGVQQNNYTPVVARFDESVFSEELDTVLIDDFDSFVEKITYNTQKYFLSADHTFDLNKLVVKAGLRGVYYKNESFGDVSVQPRLFVDYQLTDRHFLNASYATTRQFDHLVGNSALLLPQDYWLPAGGELKPETGQIVDLGYTFYTTKNHHFTANLYWKKENNKLYSNFADSINVDPTGLFPGEGESRGLELAFNQSQRKLTYKIAYAISKADRQFDDLNLAQKFPFQFDRRHEWKALCSYQLLPELSVGANLYFGTGHPRLDALEGGLSTGVLATDFSSPGQRNQIRDNQNFRLDFSLAYQKRFKNTYHQLKASFFNVLNNKRPLYHLRENANAPAEPQLSLPFLPSVAYRISF